MFRSYFIFAAANSSGDSVIVYISVFFPAAFAPEYSGKTPAAEKSQKNSAECEDQQLPCQCQMGDEKFDPSGQQRGYPEKTDDKSGNTEFHKYQQYTANKPVPVHEQTP
jgi:hypothetical protein